MWEFFLTVIFIKSKNRGTNTEFPVLELFLKSIRSCVSRLNFVVFEEFYFGRIFLRIHLLLEKVFIKARGYLESKQILSYSFAVLLRPKLMPD